MTTTIAAEDARGKSRAELEALVADGMLTMKQAVEFSGIGRTTLYELIASKRIIAAWEGRRRLIPKRELIRYRAEKMLEQQVDERGGAH